MAETSGAEGRRRIESIDLLRGLVMLLMALDHVRDFFGPAPYAPEDLSQASAGLFLTRWVTHFCAPVFVFLAGLGAGLFESGGRTRAEVSRFLVGRGLWLVLIELTVINLSWLQLVYNRFLFLQVIWALGVSMVFLGGLIWLPRWLTMLLSVALVAGHNLLDGVQPADLGAWAPLWGILHARYWIPLGGGYGLVVVYPLLPWVGVMCLGYLAAPVFRMASRRRRRLLTGLGVGLILAFVALRLVNHYGDPRGWSVQERGPWFTLLSFLNTTKYPPSLLFLLMTLGPSLWLLSRLEGRSGSPARILLPYGRVPFFFYVVHVPLIHVLAAAWSWARFGTAGWWFHAPRGWPAGYELRLDRVFLVWTMVVLALYPLCRWFDGVKSRGSSPLLRYL